MDDDLDTPGALATVFDLARRANAAADAGRRPWPPGVARTVALLCAALGLDLRAGAGDEVDADTAELVRRRDEARAAGLGPADALRASSRPPAGRSRTAPEGPASASVKPREQAADRPGSDKTSRDC